MPSVEQIKSLLEKQRFLINDEKKLQMQMADCFEKAGFLFKKEFQLSSADIPDFYFDEPAIAIEVKIKGNVMQIYRQLERYCMHNAVKVIILATAKQMGLPETINNKPAYYINLSKGWL